LNDIACVLDVAGQVREGVEKPVLILFDQLSKGRGLACQGFGDQIGVIAHVRLII